MLMGLQGGIAAKRYYQGYVLTGLENVPLIGSSLGCILTFIYSIFYLSTTSLPLPILNKIFGFSFYLDALNSFCLFCLFLCGALFVSFKRELGASHYFLLPYVNTLLLLLSGNLYFLVGLLSILMMMTYGLSIGKTIIPFIGLASLLIIVVLLPVQVGAQGNFVYLPFEILRQISFPPIILFFVLLASSVFMGFVPLSQWRMNIARQGKGDVVYNFMHLLLSMAGMYLLLRFYVDLGQKSEALWLSLLVTMMGVVAACYAGWQSLVVKSFQERISCLYILGNAVLVQTVGIVSSFMVSEQQQWISFANDVLYFGLFIQFIGFSFVFLLSGLLKAYQTTPSEKQIIPSSILISLLLLSFLLSGFPPFAGFAILWGNLQLLLTMPAGHHLTNTLLTTVILGLNAIILIVSILGWIRLILTGGVQSLQKALLELSDYFSLKSFAEIKIGIALLFIIALIPGCVFVLARSVATNVMGISEASSNFFTFTISSSHISFTPWLIAGLFIGIVLIIGWVARKERQKAPTLLLRESNSQPNTNRSIIVEETSFSFGQASFQAMLERRFSFIRYFSVINYTVCKNWIRLKKISLRHTHHINLFVWQYQNLFLLMIIAIILVSISMIAR
ncbi:unnamed protein product [Commensalibacter communis]|uniref:Uncharacterized protein n=1 Tax=Commensalibacter communis TaxID=2972786 RepID=A0A9W4TM34_9PROT|nr:hypothetical protein [Commensalibacter communis]CAI3924490.1 unnamed protein product [Commensalibacter communis]CAI3925974.1 unnamed protein product [Commensalibacter communis]CAI3936467.1 unnamed protein product [Commensalibacter communis]CAI3936992.1 unnamed protein product [Commensalibacter communis]